MNETLFKIAQDLKSSIEDISEDGEVNQELLDQITSCFESFNEKIINCTRAIDLMQQQNDYRKDLIKRIDLQHKRTETQINRLKEYVIFNMKSVEKESVESPEGVIKIVKNPPKLTVNQNSDILIFY